MSSELDDELDDDLTAPYPEAEEPAEESYRAISGLAVASLVFGGLSILVMADWALAVIPVVGVVLGIFALRRIDHYPDTLMGVTAAKMGICLSVGLGLFGVGRLYYFLHKRAPPGYQVISYKVLQPTVRGEIIPKAARDLDQRRVYIKGYMSPGRQGSRIRRFILVRDNGVCAFCSPRPKPTEMIGVELIHGLEAEYTTHLVGVGGEMSVAKDPRAGGMLYRIKADFFH